MPSPRTAACQASPPFAASEARSHPCPLSRRCGPSHPWPPASPLPSVFCGVGVVPSESTPGSGPWPKGVPAGRGLRAARRSLRLQGAEGARSPCRAAQRCRSEPAGRGAAARSVSRVRLRATHRRQPQAPAPGMLQARTLEWLPFPSPMRESEKESEVAQSCPTLQTPWTAAHQAPPPMGFPRQEHWGGCQCLLLQTPYSVSITSFPILTTHHGTTLKRSASWIHSSLESKQHPMCL